MGSPTSNRIPQEWELAALLVSQPGLSIVPGGIGELVLAGQLEVLATYNAVLIKDSYEIEMRVPRTYPDRGKPRVSETGGRIPREFHHLDDDSLCLGAPTRLRLMILDSASLKTFIELVVIPYLYSHSHFERFKTMPYGELQHGARGLAGDLVAMLQMPVGSDARSLLNALCNRKRVANKHRCPCKSGRRLGKCHNDRVNVLRKRLGRTWFKSQRMLVLGINGSR